MVKKIEINQALYQKAIALAELAHAGQVDKSGQPYILHPTRVAKSLESKGLLYAIVGVLHDTIEDTDTAVTYDEILRDFGIEIAEAVYALSRIDSPKEIYTDFIIRCKRNAIARIVKLADIEDNMSPARLSNLPLADRNIVHRYIKAKKILLSE